MLCQCATYPFHGNHLVSKFDWNAEAAKCEGIVPVDHLQPPDRMETASPGVELKFCNFSLFIFYKIHNF